jgi:hypothetical protein
MTAFLNCHSSDSPASAQASRLKSRSKGRHQLLQQRKHIIVSQSNSHTNKESGLMGVNAIEKHKHIMATTNTRLRAPDGATIVLRTRTLGGNELKFENVQE